MMGLFQEHGPWVLDDGETSFKPNPYSWNKNASMLYIEMPAGVGYSYCDDAKDCSYDDNSTAMENLEGLKNWMDLYKDFRNNDLYISGESYGGVYVPTLVYFMDQWNNNKTTPAAEKFNLKGFMVGNGVTNWTYDTTPAFVEMGYWHSLYSDELRD